MGRTNSQSGRKISRTVYRKNKLLFKKKKTPIGKNKFLFRKNKFKFKKKKLLVRKWTPIQEEQNSYLGRSRKKKRKLGSFLGFLSRSIIEGPGPAPWPGQAIAGGSQAMPQVIDRSDQSVFSLAFNEQLEEVYPDTQPYPE